MAGHKYRFGPFQLDTAERVLLRDRKPLYLKPKAFDLLLVLVENSGHVVSKDELMKQVWPDRFVEESNIAVSIFAIRKVLGESTNGQPYIENVPRRGYRFADCVVDGSNEGRKVQNQNDTSEGYASLGNGTIAVLPFKFIGPAGGRYLGLGMADALITRLSNIRKVAVRPTSSVRHYDGAYDPVLAGKELGVEWVLDGSVQRSGKQIRITVQLVNVAKRVLQWADTFEERLTDIFVVEDSISRRVAKSLATKLTPNEQRALTKRYTRSPEAYAAYLKGRYFLEKRTTDGCRKAIAYFEQAIAIDPKYALAHTGIAGCYIVLGSSTALSSQESYLQAERAIVIALNLDKKLAEAHASLGHLKTRRWDWSGAKKALERSIMLNPNYALAHTWYAIYLSEVGEFDKAFEEISNARTLDPVSPIISCTEGVILYLTRRYDLAIEQFRKTLEMDEGFALAHSFLGVAYEATGDFRGAVDEYQRAKVVLGDLPELLACVGRARALAGRTDEALKAVDKLKSLSEKRPVQPALIALIYTAVGDKGQAFRWLERAYADCDADLCLLKVDPRWDPLRADHRFLNLMKRVGFEE